MVLSGPTVMEHLGFVTVIIYFRDDSHESEMFHYGKIIQNLIIIIIIIFNILKLSSVPCIVTRVP